MARKAGCVTIQTLYRDCSCLKGREVYCNTLVYCDLKEGAREAVCIAIQTGRAAGMRKPEWGACRVSAARRRGAGRRARGRRAHEHCSSQKIFEKKN